MICGRAALECLSGGRKGLRVLNFLKNCSSKELIVYKIASWLSREIYRGHNARSRINKMTDLKGTSLLPLSGLINVHC